MDADFCKHLSDGDFVLFGKGDARLLFAVAQRNVMDFQFFGEVEIFHRFRRIVAGAYEIVAALPLFTHGSKSFPL